MAQTSHCCLSLPHTHKLAIYGLIPDGGLTTSGMLPACEPFVVCFIGTLLQVASYTSPSTDPTTYWQEYLLKPQLMLEMAQSMHWKNVLKTAENIISIIHFRLVIINNDAMMMAMILVIVTPIRNTCAPPDCLHDSLHRAKTEFLRVLTTTTLKYFFVKTLQWW